MGKTAPQSRHGGGREGAQQEDSDVVAAVHGVGGVGGVDGANILLRSQLISCVQCTLLYCWDRGLGMGNNCWERK